MKKQLSAAFLVLTLSLTALSQHRTGGFLDDEPHGSGMTFGVKPIKDKALQPEEKKIAEDFESDLFKVEMHLRVKWKDCVSKNAEVPGNILHAHQQMTLLFDPKDDGADCPSDNQVKLNCLLNDEKIYDKLSKISKSKLAKKLEVTDLRTKETYENLQVMAKQFVRMKK